MAKWIRVAPRQRVQVLSTGGILWEHDTQQPYAVARHLISSVAGATWTVESRDPLTLTPSVHCDQARGGCGLHGFIREGRFA